MRPDPAERGLARGGASGRGPATGAASLRADDRAGAAEPPVDEVERELRYWRERAGELEEQLAVTRARLLALADHLPPALAPSLSLDLDALAASPAALDVLEGWEESTLLKPASVAIELPRLWERLRRGSAA